MIPDRYVAQLDATFALTPHGQQSARRCGAGISQYLHCLARHHAAAIKDSRPPKRVQAMNPDVSSEPKLVADKSVTVQRENFRLLRYFSIAALVSFTFVGLALYLMEQREIVFFADVQVGQSKLFRDAQAELSNETEQTRAPQSGQGPRGGKRQSDAHVRQCALGRADRTFQVRAQTVSPDRCRALATSDNEAANACQGEIGLRIKSLPGFAELDQRAIATMRNSNVFKIKVFDLRGLTIYSPSTARSARTSAAMPDGARPPGAVPPAN
jgi:hypothetical protein